MESRPMSVPKKAKIEAEIEGRTVVDELLGQSRTHDSDDTTVHEERWQQFKDKLYQSDFWHQYKDRLENSDLEKSEDLKEAYKGVIEREIERAWDHTRRGSKLMQMPQTERCKEIARLSKAPGQSPLPDPSPCDQRPTSVEGPPNNSSRSDVEEKEASAMGPSGGRLQRYLVTVEYIGSRFLGWQKQRHRPDLRTVQGALEEAFKNFVGQPVACGGSSRTDTGVHALANVCHVDVERVSKRKPGEVLPPHEPEVVKRAVNHFLQKDGGDMLVVDVRTVSNDFHARFQARERTYHYRILAGKTQLSIFEKDRAWHVPEDLNLIAMQAKSPLKTLDELHVCEMPAWPSFPSLSERIPHSTNSEANWNEVNENDSLKVNDDSSETEMSRSDLNYPTISKSPCESRGIVSVRTPSTLHCYVITARARSFLYHQVRLLAGTIKAVGCGVLSVEDVRRVMAAKSITATPAMAPACGLYLAEVKYDFDNFKTRECIPNENEEDE